MDPAHERHAGERTDSDVGQPYWHLEASNPRCSDEHMLLHATGLQSGPSLAQAEVGSSPDASPPAHTSFGGVDDRGQGFRSRECGAERCRPRVSFSDVNQVFDVAKLSFRDLRGDTRDLSSTCEDPDWCSLGLARSHKLAAFAETFILRKSFARWYSSGLPCGSSDAHAAAGWGGEEEDLFLFAAPPSRDATCETEDGSAPSSWERMSSSEGHGPASGTSAGVARESTAVRVRGARRCRGRGRGGGVSGNSAPAAVDTENADSPHSSPPNRLAPPYYLGATYNSSPFLPAFPPSPSESLLAVFAARRVSGSEGEDTWSEWDSGEGDVEDSAGDSNSNSACSSLRPSLEMLRPSQDASHPIPIPSHPIPIPSPHPR
jgi:hypothetical protein